MMTATLPARAAKRKMFSPSLLRVLSAALCPERERERERERVIEMGMKMERGRDKGG